MERDYDPVDGIGRFQAGTPPILALAAVEEGVKLTAEAGIAAIRAKSIAPHRADRRAPRRLARAARLQPRLAARPARAAAPTSRVAHPEAWPINVALIERAHVVPDFRGPDAIRLGVAPLYTSHADVWDALDRLRGARRARRARLVDARPRTGHLRGLVPSQTRWYLGLEGTAKAAAGSRPRQTVT